MSCDQKLKQPLQVNRQWALMQALLAVTVCCLASTSRGQVQRSSFGENPLVSRTAALRNGLVRQWYSQAAVDRTRGGVRHLTLDEGTLFVQTSQNVLQALDAETGRVRWTERVGRASVPNPPPAAHGGNLAVVNSTTLHLLDRTTGRVVWEDDLRSPVLAAPAVTGLEKPSDNDPEAAWVYVGLITGRLVAHPLTGPTIAGAPGSESWYRGVSGRIDFPPVVCRNLVAFATTRGYVYGSDFNAQRVVFQRQVDAEIVAPMAFFPPHLYIVDGDNFLTAITADSARDSGDMAWRYNVGGAVRQAPVPLGDRVFVVRERSGLLCLQAVDQTDPPAAPGQQEGAEQVAGAPPADTPAAEEPPEPKLGGTPIWFAPGVTQFVAASPTKIYARNRPGDLVILDARSGGRLATLQLNNIDLTLVNTMNDRIYLATRSGLIQCLREVESERPEPHNWPSVNQGEAIIIQQGPLGR